MKILKSIGTTLIGVFIGAIVGGIAVWLKFPSIIDSIMDDIKVEYQRYRHRS